MHLIAKQMGVEEAVRYVARQLGKFAGRDKLAGTRPAPNVRRLGEVELTFDTEVTGLIHFRFVTPDDIEVKTGVQMLDLDRAKLAQHLNKVVDGINEHRAKRRKDSNIIWLPAR